MRAREASLLAVLAAGSSCRSVDVDASPTAPVGPPPFIGPAAPSPPAAPPPALATGAPIPARPAPLVFFKTLDSNAWVTKNFRLAARPSRVIAVSAADPAPTKVRVRRLDLNAPDDRVVGADTPAPASTTAEEELPVALTVKTLQEAADRARGGDLVAVLPGHYEGFRLGDVRDAGDERYVRFVALGKPGDVVIDAGARVDPRWMILLQGSHHVVIEGFAIAGTNTPGAKDLHGPNAGILIDGDFPHTSALAHHIAIVGVYSHGHRLWGIHSVDSHTILVEHDVFASSGKEHAAYFSDGSDDYVIRRNVFFGSHACGLQVNVDPQASLEKVVRHPAVDYEPMQPTRAWALGLLRKATERFGENAFPDGRGFNFIIESNVIDGNGRAGGAGINLAGVRESVIQNNLVYANASAGIAEWDNGNPFDAAQVTPGPQRPSDVTGADALPLFGCFNNLVRNNTIVSAVPGRAALLVGNGSWGTRAYDNVLVNDELPSVELMNTSIWRFDAAHNVLDQVSYTGAAASLKSLALGLPDGPRSVLGVTRQILAGNVVRAGEEPWVILEGAWWRRNPKRPDFHPRAGAPLLAGKGDPSVEPATDLEGRPRRSADIGAYATAAP